MKDLKHVQMEFEFNEDPYGGPLQPMRWYQEATAKTNIVPQDVRLEYLSLGLVAEAGEVAGKVAKLFRGDFTPPNAGNSLAYNEYVAGVKKELGDVMWFVSELCNLYKWEIEDVCKDNAEKLEDRAKRGVLQGSGDER